MHSTPFCPNFACCKNWGPPHNATPGLWKVDKYVPRGDHLTYVSVQRCGKFTASMKNERRGFTRFKGGDNIQNVLRAALYQGQNSAKPERWRTGHFRRVRRIGRRRQALKDNNVNLSRLWTAAASEAPTRLEYLRTSWSPWISSLWTCAACRFCNYLHSEQLLRHW